MVNECDKILQVLFFVSFSVAVGKLNHGSDAYTEYTTDQKRGAARLNKCAGGMEKSYLLMPPNNQRKNLSMESITLTESDGGKVAI